MAQRALVVCVFLLFSSCASLRKISQVETRAPAGAGNGSAISSVRAKISQNDSMSAACPEELRELLALLAEERVKFTPCPENLPAHFAAARSALRVEERSAVEELLAGQCRNVVRDQSSDPLGHLLQSLELTGKLGTRETVEFSEADWQLRRELREALLEVKQENGPLENWVRNNGEFVLAEEPLSFIGKISARPSCRMNDDEVDASYRALRGIEDLARLVDESQPQRGRIERFLVGVHKVMDQKIKEFFRP